MRPAADATRLRRDAVATVAGARGRPARLLVLVAAVVLAHVWLAGRLVPALPGDAARRHTRIDVAFVHELQPSEPPPAPAVAPPRPTARLARSLPAVAPAPEAAASAAEPALAPATPAVALALEPALPPAADALAVVAPAAAEPAASAPAFEWPPSTRLSYALSGHFRGPVEGQARVEWLKSGSRYQVVMEASVGPAFAPLMTRMAASSGEVTASGLQPQRYDEETRAVLREPRRLRIDLGPDTVRLANGRETPRPPGVQDSASQFVHLTWLFTTRPGELRVGHSVELPLALPRHVQPWIYDVVGSEVLATPAGAVEAFHVKPRREAGGGDLTAEVWIAPSLQYLPVRILVRQDRETWIDMTIERLPQQAAK